MPVSSPYLNPTAPLSCLNCKKPHSRPPLSKYKSPWIPGKPATKNLKLRWCSRWVRMGDWHSVSRLKWPIWQEVRETMVSNLCLSLWHSSRYHQSRTEGSMMLWLIVKTKISIGVTFQELTDKLWSSNMRIFSLNLSKHRHLWKSPVRTRRIPMHMRKLSELKPRVKIKKNLSIKTLYPLMTSDFHYF